MKAGAIQQGTMYTIILCSDQKLIHMVKTQWHLDTTFNGESDHPRPSVRREALSRRDVIVGWHNH